LPLSLEVYNVKGYQNILKNINILNLLLAGIILFLVLYVVLPSFDTGIEFPGPAGQKTPDSPVTGEKALPDAPIPPASEYALIADKNLFHPERKITEGDQKADTASAAKTDFVLFGTLIMDELRVAYLEDLNAPVSSPGRGKRQVALKIGDTFNGYTLNEVGAESIVMVKGDERIVVQINDQAKPKVRTKVTTAKAASTTRSQKQRPKIDTTAAAKKASSQKTGEKTVVSPFAKGNVKTAKQKTSSYKPQVDLKNNRTPGGFLFNRLNR
jgi:hypothetical protein